MSPVATFIRGCRHRMEKSHGQEFHERVVLRHGNNGKNEDDGLHHHVRSLPRGRR
jgi:hypothetical protein